MSTDRLTEWAARLVRIVCFAELSRNVEEEIAEPVRRIALEMRDAAYVKSGDPGVAVAPPPLSALAEQIEAAANYQGHWMDGCPSRDTVYGWAAAVRAVAPPPDLKTLLLGAFEAGHWAWPSTDAPTRQAQFEQWFAQHAALRAVAPPQCETCRHPPAYVPTVGQRACLCGCHASVRAVAPPQEPT